MFRMPRLSRPVFLGSALALVVLLGAGAFVARQAASAAEPLEANTVSDADVRILVKAAKSCPALTPARLAGQVMVASKFGNQPVAGMRDGGASGVAALTPQQWQQNIPWDGAQPADREAGISALAHLMCGLVGQSRAMSIGADPWRVALAAHRLGMDQVIATGGIPGDAKDYIETVERYAAWYALQPEFGGGSASPSPAAGYAAGAVIPVPDAYVAAVVKAGKICAEMPPALVAAQIMATSGFDAGKLGTAGEQGIAQFLPQVWADSVKASTKSPWQPAVAIAALGRTMCRLIKQSGGQYAPALAAFTRGSETAAVTALAETVTKAQAEYAKDIRMQLAKAPAPASSASSSTSSDTGSQPKNSASTPPPAAGRDNQPAVKADDASGGAYGPYFILNLATKMCVDLPDYGKGSLDGPVNQFTCAKTGTDNQEWTFEPRDVDDKGYQLYWIRNVDSGFCVDPPGREGVASSTSLSQTNCLDNDNQHFRLEPKKTSGGFVYYWVRNTVANMCLDVPGSGTGGADARLALVPCMANDDHEWALVEKSEW